MQWQRQNDAHHHCRPWGITPFTVAILCLFLSACASTQQQNIRQSSVGAIPQLGKAADNLALSHPQLNETIPAQPLISDSDSANFLVGQMALNNRELTVAADYFTRTLASDKTNPDLLQRSFWTLYQTSHFMEWLFVVLIILKYRPLLAK